MHSEQPAAFFSSFFSPRNILFLVMGLVTAAFVLQRAGEDRIPKGASDRLEAKQYRVVVRLFVHQAALARMNARPARAEMQKQLARNLNLLDSRGDFFHGSRALDRLVLLEYLEQETPKSLPAELRRLPGYSDYVRLYGQGKPIQETSPLLSAATGEAARITHLRVRGDRTGSAKLEDAMQVRAMVITVLGMGFLGGMFVLYMIALGIVLLRKPVRLFPAVRGMFLPQARRAFLESFVLHLFFSIPVLGLGASLVPSEHRLLFAAAGLVASFVVAVGFFAHQAGPGQLRMVLHAERAASIPREIFIGFMGFAVIFPGAVAALLITVATFEPDSGVRAAHPLVFEIEQGFWLPLLLAGVLAPIIEETIFRGFLYGYMRDFFGGMSAALLTGLVFALLHPQGVLALPYLTVLGAGLAVLRELRPGLVAPMTVHAIVNTTAVVVAYWVLHA